MRKMLWPTTVIVSVLFATTGCSAIGVDMTAITCAPLESAQVATEYAECKKYGSNTSCRRQAVEKQKNISTQCKLEARQEKYDDQREKLVNQQLKKNK